MIPWIKNPTKHHQANQWFPGARVRGRENCQGAGSNSENDERALPFGYDNDITDVPLSRFTEQYN